MTDRAKPITATVASNIRRLRKAQGLTAQELAAKITEQGHHYSRVMLAKLETGGVEDIGIDQLFAIAKALEVEPLSLTDATLLCEVCANTPPAGFTCNGCGRGAQ